MEIYFLRDTTDGMGHILVKYKCNLINITRDYVDFHNKSWEEDEQTQIQFDGTVAQAKDILRTCFYYDVIPLPMGRPSLIIDNENHITVYRNMKYHVYGTNDLILNADLVDYREGVYYI